LGLVPAQIKKKEKIGTIFCPKGGLGQVPKGPLAQSAVKMFKLPQGKKIKIPDSDHELSRFLFNLRTTVSL
jgi:hypothetical protein